MSNEVKANAKLKEIYKFLEENKEFNGILQNAVYESCLDMRKPTKIGFRLLLWDVVHTQSQTDLDKLEDFWLFMNGYCCDEKWELCDVKIFVKDLISKDFWQEGLKAIKANKELVKRGLIIEKANLGGLQEYINNMHPLDAFFEALKTTPGWGDKTAALAQKSLYNIFKEKGTKTVVSDLKLGNMHWTENEVMSRTKNGVSFDEALRTKGIIKMDVITLLNGRFIEVTEVYKICFDKKCNLDYEAEEVVREITAEYKEETASGNFMKSLKKMYSLIKREKSCLLYTSPSPRDRQKSRMPSSA